MSDDPRDILRAAGVECPELEKMDEYGVYEDWVLDYGEDAILALAKLVAEKDAQLKASIWYDMWKDENEAAAKYKWQRDEAVIGWMQDLDFFTDEETTDGSDIQRCIATLDRRWKERNAS